MFEPTQDELREQWETLNKKGKDQFFSGFGSYRVWVKTGPFQGHWLFRTFTPYHGDSFRIEQAPTPVDCFTVPECASLLAIESGGVEAALNTANAKAKAHRFDTDKELWFYWLAVYSTLQAALF